MKRFFFLPLLAAFGLSVGACQKQQTEAERNAEIERQVGERLKAEHQTEEAQKLAQRQADLDAREQALAEKEKQRAVASTPVAAVTAPPDASDTADSTEAGISATDSETGSYATFYRKLDPYGDWMETSDYGYVFQPRQAAQSRDWRPYTNGRWVYTDAGWTWLSDEKFGWATYHYGRWIRLRSVGWVWVPGEQWAPAWVSWRKGNDYVGWAPLPPEAQFDRRIGIRNWADNYYDIGPGQYAFIPTNEFGRQLTPSVIVPRERNVTIINQTTNVTNITYNNSRVVDRGPSYDELRARSRQPIERLRLERTQDFNGESPVIRGQVVALPTADFHPAEHGAHPDRVVRNIAQPEVESGWSGIQDAQAAQKAHAWMEAQATPPPNLPAKRFVRPDKKTPMLPRPSPPTPGRIVSPAVSAPTAIPVGTPAPLPSNPSLPSPRARPVVTPAVSPKQSRPGARPQPSAKAVRSAQPARPSAAETIVSPKEMKQEESRQEQVQHPTEREQKMLQRRGKKSEQPNASPTATAAPQQPAPGAAPAIPEAPGASSPNETAPNQRSNRKNSRNERKAKAGPRPTPSVSPGPNQP
ncbi:MAG: DUF6600 domain-containing protein [Chthoniobacterales bacterium]